jgi:predicted Zn-dependent protease
VTAANPMKKILLSLLLLFTISSFSQTIEDFNRLVSKGPIPSLFTDYLQTKIDSDDAKLKDDKSISRQNAKDFTAITNYKLQQLVQSGRILYGDPLTDYANMVFDKLAEVSDDDLSDIQIYTLKSNEVNAFATHQGVIFVTVGLIGQLENEAQLAYILAHEASHVTERHNQLSYQHTSELIRKGRYGDDQISSYYRYSRDNEEDADKKGFQLAIDAGYSADEIFNTFNVLLYSYLPIDEMEVDFDFIETKDFTITEKYTLDEVDAISPEEDVDDEFHTHPNINKRKDNVTALYRSYSKEETNKIFISSTKEEFTTVRNLARFEMMNIFIRQGEYIDGLYHNLILTKEFPNNDYLARTRAMTWYGNIAHSNSDGGTVFSSNYRKKEGEVQRLYYFFNKVKDIDLAVIAAKEVWKESLERPDDPFLKKIRSKVLEEFVKFDKNQIANFATEPPATKVEEDTTAKELSKYDKIAKRRKEKTTERFTYYALVNLITNRDFIDAYDVAKDVVKKKEEEEEELEEIDKPQEMSLSVTNLIMVAPNFFKTDDRKTVRNTVSKNELNETKLVELVEENAEKLNIKLSYIDNFRDPSFDTESYNEFSLLFDYLGERAKYSDFDFYPYYAQYTDTLSQKFNSNYVGVLGIYTEVEKREFSASTMLFSLVTVYLFPVYLKWQLTPDKYTDYGFYIYNLKTHNPSYISNKSFNANMNIHLQNAHIYNSLNQIAEK